jgi:antitoxin component of MazEF toxin-antitoxin module
MKDRTTQNKSGSKIGVQVSRIVPAPPSAALTLEALVQGITTENVHGEHEWDKRVGKEAW